MGGNMWAGSTDGAGTHYSVLRLDGNGMKALRQLFPCGEADDLNVVLFSTSGVHGNGLTIEDVEQDLQRGERSSLTFLVLHPRTVCVRYGNCAPETAEDIAWLKHLRASSLLALSEIGLRSRT